MVAGLSWPVYAGTCADRDTLARSLQNKYRETPVAHGIVKSGELLEIFASADGATWTMVLIERRGDVLWACAIDYGHGWRQKRPGEGT